MTLAILLLCLASGFSADILILHPFKIRGHLAYLKPLVSALTERNHKVTVVTEERHVFDESVVEVISVDLPNTKELSWENSKAHFLSDVFRLHEVTATNIHAILASQQFDTLLATNRSFDVVISNTYLFYQSLSVVAHLLNALHIEFTPQGDNAIVSLWSGNIIQGERAKYAWQTVILLLYNKYVIIARHEALLEDTCRFPGCETRPSIHQLLSRKAAILSNSHPTLSTPPSISLFQKQVAGISILPTSPLPDRIEKFINGSTNGFILMSWGTLINCCSGQLGDDILEALSRLDERVIWKTSRTEFSRPVPSNVLLSNWIPQADLLGDRRIKLFLTHGGFNSMVETVHFSVPVVVTPSSMDQPKNAAHMIAQGVGVLLSYDNLTVNSLIWSVKEVLDNPKYKRRASDLSRVFRDCLVSPIDEAVFTVENALKFKTNLPLERNHVLAIFFLSNADVFAASFVALALISILLISLSKLLKKPRLPANETRKNKKSLQTS